MGRLEKGDNRRKAQSIILASALIISCTPVQSQDINADLAGEPAIKTVLPQPEATQAPPTASSGGLQFSPESQQEPDTTAGGELSIMGAPPQGQYDGGIAPAAPEITAPQPLAPDAVSSGGAVYEEGEESRQLAQAAGGAPAKPMDPAYRELPSTTGTVRIRRQFKLFAREELIHNLSFRSTPVRDVIQEIARRGNLNIIVDKSAVGRITGDLHDVTLNEAMDSVLAASGLQSRLLENNTVIIGTQSALTTLGLNRPLARAFKLSYASPFDVAGILFTSVFNRGVQPGFTASVTSINRTRGTENPKRTTNEVSDTEQAATAEGGGVRKRKLTETSANLVDTVDEAESGENILLESRPDATRQLRGTVRTQVQEGTGFNNAAQDPGSQQIRAFQDVITDFNVEQNGGGAIVIPDARNGQVIVVGTADDLAVAEEAIRLLDRRPKQVHIQASLIELTNQGIRQLGAALNVQGEGASGTVLGGTGARPGAVPPRSG